MEFTRNPGPYKIVNVQQPADSQPRITVPDSPASQLYTDIIAAGKTPAGKPLALYLVSPMSSADTRKLTHTVMESYFTEKEFLRQQQENGMPAFWHIPGRKIKVGGVEFYMPDSGVEKIRGVREKVLVPERTEVYASTEDVGPHRYLVNGSGNLIFAANFNAEFDPENMWAIRRLPSTNAHPHIDMRMDPEGEAHFNISINGRNYPTYTFANPGSARGVGSYNLIDGIIVPYTASAANVPFFSLAIRGETPDQITRCIGDQMGHRISALAVALFSDTAWKMESTNFEQPRQFQSEQPLHIAA